MFSNVNSIPKNTDLIPFPFIDPRLSRSSNVPNNNQKLIDRYKLVLKKYKDKLEEEKKKQNKKDAKNS